MTTNDTPSDNAELLQSIADGWKAAKEEGGESKQDEKTEENAPAEA